MTIHWQLAFQPPRNVLGVWDASTGECLTAINLSGRAEYLRILNTYARLWTEPHGVTSPTWLET